MTICRTVARVSMICLIPALALAQDTPAGAPGASVLQVHDAPDRSSTSTPASVTRP